MHVKGNTNINFHILPKDPEIRNKWIEICQTNKNRTTGFVCSRHFESNAFERNLKYELLELPVPPGNNYCEHLTYPKVRLG